MRLSILRTLILINAVATLAAGNALPIALNVALRVQWSAERAFSGSVGQSAKKLMVILLAALGLRRSAAQD